MPRRPRVDLTTSVVQTLVLYALAEHQLGHARAIEVSAAGHAFRVRDDGRGHAVQRTVEGAPYLDFIYGHLDWPWGEPASRPVQLQGLGMSLLNRLCVALTVTVWKRNATLTMRFMHGQLVDHTLVDAGNQLTGNEVSGWVDAATAGQPVDEAALAQWLDEVGRANPALRLSYERASAGPTPPL